MDALNTLGQLLTISNTLAPLIAGLIGQIRSDNPGKTDEQIMEEALATAEDTRAITARDMSPEA